jgi:cell fate (sporulation/competence/biofilm development) regulator YlbF (YheA/YmcA/DUF963 family)
MTSINEEERMKEMCDPVEKAKEFAKAIVESDAHKKFVLCNNSLQNDLASKMLLAKYQSKQRWLRLGRFEPGLLDELRDLHIKVSQNEVIQNYNKSASELTELLAKTNDLISEKIGRQFAYNEGGSCCG